MDRTLRIWSIDDPARKECAGMLSKNNDGHAEVITAVCPLTMGDAKYFVSGSMDAHLKVWNSSGGCDFTQKCNGAILALDATQDPAGKAVVVIGLVDGTVELRQPDLGFKLRSTLSNKFSVGHNGSHVPRRGRLKAPAAATAAVALDAEVDLTMDASAESRPPNIVLITLDDVGLNDLGFMSTDLKGVTPRMDAMASQGIRLTNYYGQSLCTPARTALMSGNQDMGGVAAVDMLNMTAAGDGASTYEAATPPETRDGLPNYYTDLLFRDEALRARAEHRRTQPDTPLFLWYAPHGPHSDKASWPPRELVDDDTWSLLGDLKKSLSRERLGFALALSATDGSIGAIVDALSADGPLFVAVSSDNGADPCAAQFSGSNYPYMGGKKTFYEGGVHLPAFVWANDASGLMAAPGARTAALQGVRGSSFAGLMHHVDWVATLSSVAGRADHDFIDADYDSVDQYAALSGERADRYRPLYLTLRANPTVVVDDGYKVLYRARKSAAVAPDGVDADSCDAFHNVAEIEKQYFNLKRDPYEENNTFTDSPALHEVPACEARF
ncbi:sulfuric ester hydrolase [Aureococcus anophagefferens]|nr:sulfuric ester hydrolase [Aureococcus anophagefferens]